MKRLTLIRHGKSSWSHAVDDHQRPLKPRALEDADLVIQAFRLHLQNRTPVLWTSSARRALDSARMFQDQLNISSENFAILKELYTFDSRALKRVIQSCGDHIEDLIIFGHNPAITDLSEELGSQSFENVPTTGLVAMEFESTKWKEISNGMTVQYLFPKNLR